MEQLSKERIFRSILCTDFLAKMNCNFNLTRDISVASAHRHLFAAKLIITTLLCRMYLINLHNVNINVPTHQSQSVIYSLFTHLSGGASACGFGSCCQSSDVKVTVTLV